MKLPEIKLESSVNCQFEEIHNQSVVHEPVDSQALSDAQETGNCLLRLLLAFHLHDKPDVSRLVEFILEGQR